MRAQKLKHLCSANSEDAVTWNVFRSLRQIDPCVWLPALAESAAPSLRLGPHPGLIVELWKSVPPPPALWLSGDEGDSEIDVIIECPEWVWFIEAKYGSDVSLGTTTRPTRNQVIRNIDVGSYYAGTRPFHFSLLVHSEAASRAGVELVAAYQDLSAPRALLAAHRSDGLTNLMSVSLLSWARLGGVMESASQAGSRPDEQEHARKALAWMRERRLM